MKLKTEFVRIEYHPKPTAVFRQVGILIPKEIKLLSYMQYRKEANQDITKMQKEFDDSRKEAPGREHVGIFTATEKGILQRIKYLQKTNRDTTELERGLKEFRKAQNEK